MDKETFSSYGWVVITVIVIAIMITFASPFGNAIRDAVEDVLADFLATTENALDDIPSLVIDNASN